MRIFAEGRLEFSFPAPWNVRKWDGEPAYQQGIKKLQESKAMDFVAEQSAGLLLIEVKDFRGHRIENKARLKDRDLAVEVAQKVRDTLAGILGANRVHTYGDDWRPFVDAAVTLKKPVSIVLWLEQDHSPRSAPGAKDQARNTLEQHLKGQLRWLTTHVFVVSLDHSQRLKDISVRNI
jgi:hypothetical protein